MPLGLRAEYSDNDPAQKGPGRWHNPQHPFSEFPVCTMEEWGITCWMAWIISCQPFKKEEMAPIAQKMKDYSPRPGHEPDGNAQQKPPAGPAGRGHYPYGLNIWHDESYN